jgi:TRAF3-interacting protein 1
MLEPLVDKPKILTAKLLCKPPVAFVRDIAVSVFRRVNDFPNGYFKPEELDGKMETNEKLSFLTKLIDYVSAWCDSDPHLRTYVKPKKIAAGAEPENTNKLLQQLAVAAVSGVSSTEVLARLGRASGLRGAGASPGSTANLEGLPIPAPIPAPAPAPAPLDERSRTGRVSANAPVPAVPVAHAGRREQEDAGPAPSSFGQSQSLHGKAGSGLPVMPRLPLGDLKKEDRSEAKDPSDVGGDGEGGGESSGQNRPPARPRTARPPPPKVKSNLVVEERKEASDDRKDAVEAKGGAAESKAAASGVTSGVILEGEAAAEEEEEEAEEQEALRGFEPDSLLDAAGDMAQHGKLMRGILQAQRAGEDKKDEGGIKLAAKLGSAKRSVTSAGFTREQISSLRMTVQKVCQSVNPLGKCMELVFDDVEHMNKVRRNCVCVGGVFFFLFSLFSFCSFLFSFSSFLFSVLCSLFSVL